MRKNKKQVAALAVIAALVWTPILNVQALSGWTFSGEEWRYLDKNGEELSGKWISENNRKYYLDDSGLMVSESLLEINDKLYFFSSDGIMTTNEWVQIQDEEDNEIYWYYFGSSGQAHRRTDKSFKKTIDGRQYIFDGDGRLLTGWFDADGNEIDEERPFITGVYYAGKDGALYKNQWVTYANGDEHDTTSEWATESYDGYPELWLYFDANGKKIQGSLEEFKEKKIDDVTYGFDENGVMLFGWTGVASGSNATKYYSETDGTRLSSTWYYTVPAGEMNKEDYDNQEQSWFYFTANGTIVRNAIKDVNGKKYFFDSVGRMQSGFVVHHSADAAMTRYKANKYASAAFAFGTIPDIAAADLYFFSTDKEDGSRVTGETKIKLDDGTFTFLFRSNGKPYGANNTLERYKDKYYINGLRLVADADVKYGVVEVKNHEENTVYAVVDTAGKIQTGNKTLKHGNQSDNDGWFIVVNGEFKAYVETGKTPKWYKNGAEGAGYYYYDENTKAAGDFIAGADSAPILTDIPEEGNLNFGESSSGSSSDGSGQRG